MQNQQKIYEFVLWNLSAISKWTLTKKDQSVGSMKFYGHFEMLMDTYCT